MVNYQRLILRRAAGSAGEGKPRSPIHWKPSSSARWSHILWIFYWLVVGFNPSEKYESVGMIFPFPTEWKVSQNSMVPNHQPVIIVLFWRFADRGTPQDETWPLYRFRFPEVLMEPGDLSEQWSIRHLYIYIYRYIHMYKYRYRYRYMYRYRYRYT